MCHIRAQKVKFAPLCQFAQPAKPVVATAAVSAYTAMLNVVGAVAGPRLQYREGYFVPGLFLFAMNPGGRRMMPARPVPPGKCLMIAVLLAVAPAWAGDEKVSYFKQIRPTFQQDCQGCHQPAKKSGRFAMMTVAEMQKGGDSGEAAFAPGKPDESFLIGEIVSLGGCDGKVRLFDAETGALMKEFVPVPLTVVAATP